MTKGLGDEMTQVMSVRIQILFWVSASLANTRTSLYIDQISEYGLAIG